MCYNSVSETDTTTDTGPAMTIKTKSEDNNYIPKDYQDLYQYYVIGKGNGNSLTHQLIRGFLPYATDDEKETLAHDVFLRCLEKDMLKVFDATKANFGGVIFFVTRTICSNHLSRKSRTPLTGLNGGSLATSDPEDGEFEPGTYNMDRIFGSAIPEVEKEMDAKALVGQLMAWAKELYDTPRHKRDRSLYPLLVLVANQASPEECGEELGVTKSTISNWMKVIQEQARELMID